MHLLISIDKLDKLTDLKLVRLDAALRNLILTADVGDADLRRLLASLSNGVFVRSRRLSDAARLEIPAP